MVLPFTAFILATAVFSLTSAEFSDHFGQFLSSRFGDDVRAHLERRDLGIWGSFGGKKTADEPVNNQPVVFVHGVCVL